MAFQNPLDSDIANDPQCATWNPTSVQCVCGKWIPLRPSPSSRLEPWEVHKTLCPLQTFTSMDSRRPPTPLWQNLCAPHLDRQALRPSYDDPHQNQISGDSRVNTASINSSNLPLASHVSTRQISSNATEPFRTQYQIGSPGPSTTRSRKGRKHLWSSGPSLDPIDSGEPSRVQTRSIGYDDSLQDISIRTEPMDVDVGLSPIMIHPSSASNTAHNPMANIWTGIACTFRFRVKWKDPESDGTGHGHGGSEEVLAPNSAGGSISGNTSGTPIVVDEDSRTSAWISDSDNNPLDVQTSVQRPKITELCAQRGFSPDKSDLPTSTPRPPIYFRPQYPSFFPDSHQEPLNKLTSRIPVQWFQQGVRETMDRQEAGYPDLVGAYLNAPVSYADDSANTIARDNQPEIVAASAYEDPAIASQ
ncbi:hypothetical protein SISNIDRAFT_486868 [Sistotremastrum niveocremeum HHB9708]|uniref:Uncharacterized protein n=1 Tax=Sistotremastrum niveocremeum HHB9708 TaxID=1314777 RepID=A0A164SYS3_9AGAM|nr:hypothetical protein SISNIDRAFT_486868 [Sistotremastrum niveocremeum HHB9708]